MKLWVDYYEGWIRVSVREWLLVLWRERGIRKWWWMKATRVTM